MFYSNINEVNEKFSLKKRRLLIRINIILVQTLMKTKLVYYKYPCGSKLQTL
jgi:hypothetical protein